MPLPRYTALKESGTARCQTQYIVETHAGALEITSTANAGTQASFSLTIAKE